MAAVVAALNFSAVLSTFSWLRFCSVVGSLFVLGWCAGECIFRGLAGRLDLFLFLRPAGAERTPAFFGDGWVGCHGAASGSLSASARDC